MTHKVGPKGQVVIPKEYRDALGILPGDLVSFRLTEGRVEVVPAPGERPLRGRFAGHRLTDELRREREADREREDRR